MLAFGRSLVKSAWRAETKPATTLPGVLGHGISTFLEARLVAREHISSSFCSGALPGSSSGQEASSRRFPQESKEEQVRARGALHEPEILECGLCRHIARTMKLKFQIVPERGLVARIFTKLGLVGTARRDETSYDTPGVFGSGIPTFLETQQFRKNWTSRRNGISKNTSSPNLPRACVA